ncbi:MAG: class II glutamine amidotransferase, partial [candidate division KSB1 bacterium]|nr:class II glutamine amidotransferase [candidate division KSB1 bacterium]
DQNERHEKNKDQPFQHGDGWGIAYLEDAELKIFRSPKAVYDDPQIDQFRNLPTRLLLLHARKASKGHVELRNVHPFQCQFHGRRYVFCHNGTIHDPLPFDGELRPISDTDSERLFFYLLSGTQAQPSPASMRAKLAALNRYTAANFLMTDGETGFAGNWYTENPNYYAMKLLQRPGLVVVASEVLPHYKNDNWKKLENRDIVSIRTDDLAIKID